MICVDANIVVYSIVYPELEAIQQLRRRWAQEERRLIAPRLLLYEATNVIHRVRLAGTLTDEGMDIAHAAVLELAIELYDDEWIHSEALLIAKQLGLPAAYDAHYLALAEKSNVEFWTADARLFRKASPTMPFVRLATEDAG